MAISLINAIIKSSSKHVDEDVSGLEILKDSHETSNDEKYVNMCPRRIYFNEKVEVKVVKRLYNSEKKRRISFYNTFDFVTFNTESKKKV